MNLPWSERIGVRLGVAVAVVLLLLAVVSNVLTNVAFERAARAVQQASAVELERSARESLREITEREAQLIASALEQYAVASRTAAAYLRHVFEEAAVDGEPSPLVEGASGHWFDANPARGTTAHVPSQHATLMSVARDAVPSQTLDDLFPVLFSNLRDAVGIYFTNPDGFIRYYPPVDFTALLAPDFDVTVQPVFQLGRPELNPNRITRWTPPYTDDAGNGLTVTVLSPVYANGEFRGTIDIDVSLVRLADRLARLTPLPESFALLVGAEGRLITASPGATSLLGYPDGLAFGERLDGPHLSGLLGQLGDGSSTTTILEDVEVPVVVAHAGLSGVDWTLLIGAPVSAVATPAAEIAEAIAQQAQRARQTNAAVGIGMFAFALAVLVIATRRWVLAPINRLVAGTRRIGEGELGATLTVGSGGEFGVLGEAFNRMSHSLAHQRGEILRHQEDLERQVAERTRELGNLFSISADLSAAPDAPSLLTAVLERLCDTVRFASGSVWVIEGDSARRIASVGRGEAQATERTAVASAELRAVIAQARSADQVSLSRSHGALPAIFDANVETALLAPLAYRGRLVGVLALADPELTESHQADLLATVAHQLGTALENARLLLEARERSALEERQHLARELHDSVSQALFGIVLGMQMAKKEATEPGRLRDAIDYSSELADGALKEMRALIYELRPEALETEGLAGLLGRQAEALRARHEIEVDLTLSEPALPLNAKAVLYRVAQEALHNVVKHAHATSVWLSLHTGDGHVRLEVRDDGRGFQVGTQRSESYGLHSMTERMALLGGHLEVASEPGSGTRVSATLPLVGANGA